MSSPERLFLSSSGLVYRVRLTLHEMRGGVSRKRRTLCFETARGDWVGALPVYPSVRLEHFTGQELEELMEHASSEL
jgi:hypothetical protein